MTDYKWTMEGGNQIKLSQMTSQHIRNARMMLLNQISEIYKYGEPDFLPPWVREETEETIFRKQWWISRFDQEMDRRSTIPSKDAKRWVGSKGS